jgi:carbamoyl-phosphate synthase large subunit
MISEPDTIRICLDKYLFYTFLVKNNITTIPTSLDINSLKVKKYVVKNRFSQGKKNNFVNLNYKTCKILSQKIEQPIFQKFIKGDEISIDCYVGSVGNCKILMRYRRSVNHGESEHTVFFKNKKIYKQIKKIINKLSFFGHIMFQGIISKGIFYVMECNPRIGGASIVCFYKNLDSFFLFINENLKIKKNRIITPRLIKNNSFILHKTVTSID